METTKYVLKDLLTIKNGKDHKALADGPYPVFGTGGVMRYAEKYLYDKVSILLPRKGTLTNIQYVDQPFWTVDTIYYTVVNEKLADPYYLFCYVNSLDLSGYDSGASIPSMTQKAYNKIKINLPDKETQKTLGEAIKAYDDLIENNNKRIAILEQMAENLYKEWFVRFRFPGYKNTQLVDGLPKEWEIEPISKNNKCYLGGTPSREVSEYWDMGTIPWINSGAINQFRICEESELITPLALEKSATKLLPLRSTLVAITGATLGQVSMNEIEVCANQSVVGITNNNGHSSFMYFVIKQNIKHIANFASGGAQQHINKEIIEKYKIIYPSITLLDKFENIVSSYFDEIRDIIFMNKNLKKQRDLLLPRLMSGKLEV